ALPQTCANKRHWSRADLVLAWREHTSSCLLHTEQRKKLRRDELTAYALGVIQTGETERVCARDRHGRKGMVLLLPVTKVGIRDRSLLKVHLALMQRDELFWMRVGERIQQNSIDHRKNRAVGANAERECQDCDYCEARRLQQRPH